MEVEIQGDLDALLAGHGRRQRLPLLLLGRSVYAFVCVHR